MSLLKGPNSNTGGSSAVFPQYTGIQLPTSANSLPIPICYGMSKLGVNIFFYSGFTQVPILTWSGSAWIVTGWYYTANLEMAICDGNITGIGQVFNGNSQWLFSAGAPNPLGLSLPYWNQSVSLFKGTLTQNPWSFLSGGGFTQRLATSAISYRGLSYIAGAAYNLGSSASLGTLQLEVAGISYGTGFNNIDADPALVIEDFLTNAQYGAGFPLAELDTTKLLGSTGDSSVQTYCRAIGFAFSPQIVQWEAANSILTRWLQLLNCGAFFSQGLLKIVPYGDLNLTGVDGTQWVAPITPVANLDDKAFLSKGNDDPVRIERIDPLTLSTVQAIECLNRAGVNVASALYIAQVNHNLAVLSALSGHGGGGSEPQPQGLPQYNPTPVYARDSSMIAGVGLRQGSTVTAHEICDIDIASRIIQIILQRGLYIRTIYKFSLSWEYCLLDPMDVVTLTDSFLGLTQKTVRITSITEGNDGTLDIVAEDLVAGVSTPGYNLTSGTSYNPVNVALPTLPTNSFLIFKAPSSLAGVSGQTWFGASGGANGSPDPNWGGAYVWGSIDGTNYQQIGTINGVMPLGVLTAAYPSATGWDTTDTLSVGLEQSGQALQSTSLVNAQAGAANVSLLGGSSGELVAFQIATLTGAEAYDLTNIQRGLFSSTAAAWPIGKPFAQLSNALKATLPPSFTGTTVYFKFQSFNAFGAAVQDISTCAVWTFPSTSSVMQVSNPSMVIAASGASITVPLTIPAGSIVQSVEVQNITAISGPTSYNVDPQFASGGGAGPTSGTWGSNTVSANASHTTTVGGSAWGTATEIVLTPVGGSFSGGSIRVVVTYITL